MLLTISTTYQPATDLGYLLYKHPARLQTEDLWFGKAHIFYPESSPERCTVALVLDVDPVGLVRRKHSKSSSVTLEPYVNDRPYVASSLMSVAISKAFSTALGGRSKERQELAETPIPFEVKIAVVPCRGGEEVLRRLFEPLGYEVSAGNHPLDEVFSDWGPGPYYTVELSGTCRLSELLNHLYILLPVMDDKKHYWVGDDEVEKLLRRGEGWLKDHPAKEMITERYLKHRRRLTKAALEQLVHEEGLEQPQDENKGETEAVIEKELSLNEQRMGTVVSVLKSEAAKKVLDLGCGEGKLLKMLIKDKSFESILGVDVSTRALERAKDRLYWETMAPKQKERVGLQHGSLMYRDKRLEGFDAAVVIEVIEHLNEYRLSAFERVVFEFARPRTVVVTTPNVEYNIHYDWLKEGKFRHWDHQFEWTRTEFNNWAGEVSKRFGYSVRFLPIGPDEPDTGPPTQMAVFSLES